MKNILKLVPYFLFVVSISFTACSDDSINYIENENFAKSSKTDNIDEIIFAIDKTVIYSLNNEVTENQLMDYFINQLENQNVELINFYNYPNSVDELEMSNDYWLLATQISDAPKYNSPQDYLDSLEDIQKNIDNYDLTEIEKSISLTNIKFMQSFTHYLQDIQISKSSELAKADCDGWWSCWGRCVLGTIGSAISGLVAGCGTGAGLGGLVGAAIASIPGIGIAAPLAAGIGAILGCVGGGIVGTIAGGLTGAAGFCG